MMIKQPSMVIWTTTDLKNRQKQEMKKKKIGMVRLLDGLTCVIDGDDDVTLTRKVQRIVKKKESIGKQRTFKKTQNDTEEV